MQQNGTFVISLDFELFWGVRDCETLESYGKNILGVWEALPQMLEMFQQYEINATFSTVGFLFASNKEELKSYLPQEKPNYQDKNLSPYNGHLEGLSTTVDDKYHFAPALIHLIRQYAGHEIGTHTFSHYYCLKKGQTVEDFRRDLLAAIEIAKPQGIELSSIVFPRHQFNDDYLQICKEVGIRIYRGNEESWLYNVKFDHSLKTLCQRGLKLLDTYINISGHHCHDLKWKKDDLLNIPASRFLRPYSSKLRLLEPLKLKRIKDSMTIAAQTNKVFHLWWHPHNFGVDSEKNLEGLAAILEHYQKLKQQYNFKSRTMSSLGTRVK